MQLILNQQIPTTIEELEEQIRLIDERRALCSEQIKDYMAKEDMEKKIFFHEQIHSLTQERNMLETHREFRRVRISRLKLEESI